MKKLYILPGWGEQITDSNYQTLLSAIKNKYQIVRLPFQTRNETYSLGSDKPLEEIVSIIKSAIIAPSPNDVILGFSSGAVIAYIIAQNFDIGQTILCSIPPIIGEKILQIPPNELNDLTVQQREDLSKISYTSVKSRSVTLLFGENDLEIIREFCAFLHEKLNKKTESKLIEIKKVGHKIEGPYLENLINLLLSQAS